MDLQLNQDKWQTLWRWLDRLGPVIALALVMLVFVVVNGTNFLRPSNLADIGANSVVIAIAAIGALLIIITGGIDLSVGSMIALSAVVGAVVTRSTGNPALGVLAAVVAGSLCGLLNGLLIVGLRLVPFVVTLGTMMIFRGLAQQFGDKSVVYPTLEQLGFLQHMLYVRTVDWPWWWAPACVMLLPIGVWVMLIVGAKTAAVLHFTKYGRYVYAIGSNLATARLCGIPVKSTQVVTYALGGVFGGLAGCMHLAYLGGGDSTGAMGYELDVIAAVVIGGGSLAGGSGSVMGAIIGALIMQTIRTGGQQAGLETHWQHIVSGSIIIGALALDRVRHRGTD